MRCLPLAPEHALYLFLSRSLLKLFFAQKLATSARGCLPRNWVKVSASGQALVAHTEKRKFSFYLFYSWPTFVAWQLNVSSTADYMGDGDNDKDTYPGTVVIEAIHAIVAQTAVRGTWWPEYLAGETILQLDRLPLDEHLLGAWRRAVCGTVQGVWHFYTRSKVRNGSGCAAAAYGNAASASSAALATKSSSLLTCKENGNGREGKKEQKFSHFKHFPQWQQQQLIRVKAALPLPAPSPSPLPAHSL